MKFYSSPRWSGEILDCSMPMTFDTYNKCSYNCLYCFSYFQKSHSMQVDNYQAGDLAWVDYNHIKKMFTLEKQTQFSDYIKQKKVMQWGGLADQFDEHERKFGKSLELMKLFKELDYPLCFSTKGTWFLSDDKYVELIEGQKNWNFKVSIINLNEETAKKMELGVDSPAVRLQALKKIKELNCGGATLRLRPFIVGFSDKDYLDLIQEAIKVGITAVTTEFLCIEGRADNRLKKRYSKISELIGYDLIDYYAHFSQSKSGYMRLNKKLKLPYVEKMKKICDENNVRFYVSDAHCKEFCHNGSCCGLPDDWNYSKGQFTEAIVIAKNKGKVFFSDITKELEMFKNILWKNAQGFNTGTVEKRVRFEKFTMFDYIRRAWNNPNEKTSPYKYFGGKLTPVGLDSNNDVIYQYVE